MVPVGRIFWHKILEINNIIELISILVCTFLYELISILQVHKLILNLIKIKEKQRKRDYK